MAPKADPRTSAEIAEAERLVVDNSSRALAVATACAERARTNGDRHGEACALRVRAHANKALERHDRALADYERSRRLFLRLGDRHEAARTLIGRVDALMYLDRLDEARRVGRRAIDELDTLGDAVRVGRVLMNLGNLEQRRDRPKRALALYERARAAIAGSPEMDLAFVDHNLGVILIQLGRTDEAESRFESVRRAAARASHAMMAAFAEFHLAELDFARARHVRALERLSTCEAAFGALGHERARCNCLLDRAEIYHQLGLDPEARHAAEEAEAGFRRLGLGMEANRARFFRGLATMTAGDRARGRRLVRTAARAFAELGNASQAAAAELRLVQLDSGTLAPARVGRTDRLAAAGRIFRREGLHALAIETDIERARLEIGSGRSAPAIRRLRSAERALAGSGRPELFARISHLRAIVHERRGERDQAATEIGACLDLLDRFRNRLGSAEYAGAHLRRSRDLYQDGFRILRGTPEPDPALVLAHLSAIESSGWIVRRREGGVALDRERDALREELSALTAPDRSALPPSGRISDERARVRRVRKLERALQERKSRRVGSRRGGAPSGGRRERASLETLRSHLDDGDLWLQLIDERDAIGVLLITREGARSSESRLDPARVRDHLARLTYHTEMLRADERVGARRREHLRRSAALGLDRLGTVCLAPFAAEIARARRVLIRPAAGLDALPWGALTFDGAPLWERASVSLVASPASAYPSAGRHRPHRRRVSPAGKGAQLWGARGSDLPGVDEELRRISRHLPGCEVHTGADASARSFIRNAPRASLIHFAGHGTFRRDNPLFSSLRFVDRDLTFLDLEEIAVRASLVVLSACGTGRTREELGIGTGLSRGFLEAGAKALVVSLWRIGDDASAAFMDTFYEALATDPEPVNALRESALRLRRAGFHPADWAAFQIVTRSHDRGVSLC